MAGAPAALEYMRTVMERLELLAHEQEPAIAAAAELCHAAVAADGMIYLLGVGHGHLLAEEGHFRAGGLAAVCPILSAPLMLHEGAAAGGRYERLAGIGPLLVDRYGVGGNDVLVVFSNAGVGTVPVEAAVHAHAKGAKVIAVVALDYADATALGPAGKRLADVADVVLDNGVPMGDALVSSGYDGLKAGALSTVAGTFVLNALLVEVVRRLSAGGKPPPVYISAAMPGAADANRRLVARYRPRNPHL